MILLGAVVVILLLVNVNLAHRLHSQKHAHQCAVDKYVEVREKYRAAVQNPNES